MNYIMLGTIATSLAWSSAALARDVDLVNFQGPIAPSSSGQFVLQLPRTRHDVAPIAPRRPEDLALAFESLAEGSATTLAPDDASAVALPKAGKFVQPNRWQLRTDIMTQSNCASEPYRPNPALALAAERRRATWYPAVAAAACEAGLPVLLLDALVIQESRYNPAALSPKGAAGISQLMPDRARLLGVRNVWNPLENLRGGAHHLRTLLDEFGRFDLALAAYNAGEGRVRRRHEVPYIRETMGYVSRILLTMRSGIARGQ